MKAQIGAFATVSAASYQPVVAPDSLASIFGSGLAGGTETAQPDSKGQLPTQLAGTTVQVNGEDAPLLYVSPKQINFLVPGDTVAGAAEIVVRTSSNSAGLIGAAQVSNTAPGLFDGAVINAVTGATSPFLVETLQNGGDDKRTRLAVFGTGIRRANIVTAEARDSSNHIFSLAVEFAAPAQGYFGLDQINLVVPPEMDGADLVALTITADITISNIIIFQMNALPASAIRVASLSIDPAAVPAGTTATGTVSLNGVAPQTGIVITLQANSGAVQVPTSLAIPPGRVSAQFQIATFTAGFTQSVTLTARTGNSVTTGSLEIDPANNVQLQSFTLNPTPMQGGTNVNAIIILSAMATVNTRVTLSTDNPVLKIPETVFIPAGQSSATVPIATALVSTVQTATVTATLGRITLQASVSVSPPLTLIVPAGPVTGGTTLVSTVVLFQPAPAGGVSVLLSSDNLAAQVDGIVFIPTGQQSAQFNVTTTPVTGARIATISATFVGAGIVVKATVTLTAPGASALFDFTISPTTVTAGDTVIGTVSVDPGAPFTGLIVRLTSSVLVGLPIPVPVLHSGETVVSFPITTSQFTAKGPIYITAFVGGVSKTVTLIVR